MRFHWKLEIVYVMGFPQVLLPSFSAVRLGSGVVPVTAKLNSVAVFHPAWDRRSTRGGTRRQGQPSHPGIPPVAGSVTILVMSSVQSLRLQPSWQTLSL